MPEAKSDNWATVEVNHAESRTAEMSDAETADARTAKVSSAAKVSAAEMPTSTTEMAASAAMATAVTRGQNYATCKTAEAYQRDCREQNSEETPHRTPSRSYEPPSRHINPATPGIHP